MPFIYIVSIASPLFPLIVGFRKRWSILWWYALLCIVAELLTSSTKHFTQYDPKIFANPFLLLEYILLSVAYRKTVLHDNGMFYFVVPGLICIFLFHTMRGGFKEFNLVGASVFFFAYILYSLFGFY